MANLSVASTAPFSDISKKYTPAAQPLRGTIIVSPGCPLLLNSFTVLPPASKMRNVASCTGRAERSWKF